MKRTRSRRQAKEWKPISYTHLLDGLSLGCKNNGIPNVDTRKCECQPFFTGKKCENRMCLNGGELESWRRITRCGCKSPFITGPHCELLLCANGGVNVPSGCECPSLRYGGPFCEVDRVATATPAVGIVSVLFVLLSFLIFFCYRKNKSPNSSKKTASFENETFEKI